MPCIEITQRDVDRESAQEQRRSAIQSQKSEQEIMGLKEQINKVTRLLCYVQPFLRHEVYDGEYGKELKQWHSDHTEVDRNRMRQWLDTQALDTRDKQLLLDILDEECTK